MFHCQDLPQSMLSDLNSMFHELTSTTVYTTVQVHVTFGATLKFIKNLKLVRISSKLMYNIRTCICIRKKIIKMKNSHLAIFDKIWFNQRLYPT